MSRNGTFKRKRSSEPDGDVENLPISDAKRLKEEEIADVRLPLAELPLRARLMSNDDSDWLEARTEEVLEDSNDSIIKDTITICISDDESESTESVDSVDSPPSPLVSTLARNFSILFGSRKHFTCKRNIVNFFKRKNCSSSDDRTDLLFESNPQLQPRMRSVLLEWIVEVCDVYKLHRETYHLTVDYLDRYLCKSVEICKSQLQLIGVTALFLAAKYEEIYPPKISDFAYITDGACTESDILKMENLMVQVLQWRCTVITSNNWLLGFLQLLSFPESEDCDIDIAIPMYSLSSHKKMSHLLDLCSLDCGFIKYPYKILALSSIHTVVNDPDPLLLQVTEYTRDDLQECVQWMQPFWAILCSKYSYENCESADLKPESPVKTHNYDVTHLRAKHNVDLELLEAAHNMAESRNAHIPELLLTPPLSTEKGAKGTR